MHVRCLRLIDVPGVVSLLCNLERKHPAIKKIELMKGTANGGDTGRIGTPNGACNVHDQMVLRGPRIGWILRSLKLEAKAQPRNTGPGNCAWLGIVYSAISR